MTDLGVDLERHVRQQECKCKAKRHTIILCTQKHDQWHSSNGHVSSGLVGRTTAHMEGMSSRLPQSSDTLLVLSADNP
jgi:hypothetical protein